SRGLYRWTWARDGVVGAADKREVAQLPARIVAPPAVLPAADDRPVGVVIADADRRLTLYQGEDLREARTWGLDGGVTAGPFGRGRWFGCILDRKKLVWWDPKEPKPLWTQEMKTAIVGEPQLVAPTIVAIATVDGRVAGFDPVKGRPTGL